MKRGIYNRLGKKEEGVLGGDFYGLMVVGLMMIEPGPVWLAEGNHSVALPLLGEGRLHRHSASTDGD